MKANAKRLWLWCNEGGHRLIVTPMLAVLIVVVSTAWQIHDVPHDIVRAFFAYRGSQMLSTHSFRVITSAVLIPNIDFYLALPGLILALYPLERRIGAFAVLAITFTAHIAATLATGTFNRLTEDHNALVHMDVGSSVLMVSGVSALAAYTRNKWIALIIAGGMLLDFVLAHDLATTEHVISITLGSISGAYLRKRERQLAGIGHAGGLE